jgi:hypothetical protein
MSETTVNDVLNLFNAIDDVLDQFGVKEASHHAPAEVSHALMKRFGVTVEPYTTATNELYRKLVLLHAYAQTMRRAPIGIGRAGAGKK